jgi:hypothetical protein
LEKGAFPNPEIHCSGMGDYFAYSSRFRSNYFCLPASTFPGELRIEGNLKCCDRLSAFEEFQRDNL